jgi:hypothetical protein
MRSSSFLRAKPVCPLEGGSQEKIQSKAIKKKEKEVIFFSLTACFNALFIIECSLLFGTGWGF